MDSRFRGNDGVKIGGGGATIVYFNIISIHTISPPPSAGAERKTQWNKAT